MERWEKTCKNDQLAVMDELEKMNELQDLKPKEIDLRFLGRIRRRE